MKKRGVVRIIIILALISIVAVSVLAFTYRGNSENKALPVAVYRAGRSALEETVSGTGSFVPETSSMVYARVGGSVEEVPVQVGDVVRKGDLLVRLDADEYERAVLQAETVMETARRSILQSLTTMRASYRNAVTAYDQTQRTFEKNRELFGIQAVSEEVLNQSRDAMESASINLRSAREQLNLFLGLPPEADPQTVSLSDEELVAAAPEVRQAELSLESARVNRGRTLITAPHDGTLTQLMPSEGDLIAPNSPVAKVESLTEMNAEILIDEVDIGKIGRRQTAGITSDSILGETLSGTVERISPVISQVGNTRVSTVKIDMDETELPLKAGASCTARITTRTKEGALVIPLSAFISRGNLSYVYVLHPLEEEGNGEAETEAEGSAENGGESSGDSAQSETNAPAAGVAEVDAVEVKDPQQPAGEEGKLYRLEERQIETGLSSVNQIEVTSGLSEGDLIVNGQMDILRDGMTVTPIPGVREERQR